MEEGRGAAAGMRMRDGGREERAGGAPRDARRRGRAIRAAAAVLAAAALIAGCARQSPPQKALVHTTKAFDAIFGALPPMSVPGPCYATVAYFPSAREPGKFTPAPIFSAEQGKEAWLSVRTVVRGIPGAGSFTASVAPPFPEGSDLDALSVEGGVARIRIAGPFRAADLAGDRREAAARALALTVAQFGKAREVEVTDVAGTARFRGTADGAAVVDVGPPQVLGVLAIKEKADRPATALSVLFDRPVFVDDIAFYAPGATGPVAGKIYATGFGMTAELHPDGPAPLNTRDAWRVKVKVRDGKGRGAVVDRTWVPREVTRD